MTCGVPTASPFRTSLSSIKRLLHFNRKRTTVKLNLQPSPASEFLLTVIPGDDLFKDDLHEERIGSADKVLVARVLGGAKVALRHRITELLKHPLIVDELHRSLDHNPFVVLETVTPINDEGHLLIDLQVPALFGSWRRLYIQFTIQQDVPHRHDVRLAVAIHSR